ncbi:hypothetical protein [uncultured Nitrospira sp.]|uniref:hypothetical protein n=1 Tax=uncultured Nitrospira sp. TaxID=157176 RepID=UPI003140C3C1
MDAKIFEQPGRNISCDRRTRYQTTPSFTNGCTRFFSLHDFRMPEKGMAMVSSRLEQEHDIEKLCSRAASEYGTNKDCYMTMFFRNIPGCSTDQ